ncbi:MAG: hypothetical protein ACFFC7_33170 [Candidatus Hermodarchaeota archaeon]
MSASIGFENRLIPDWRGRRVYHVKTTPIQRRNQSMSKTTQKMPKEKIFRLPSPYWQYLIHVAFEKYPYDQQRQLIKKTEKCLLKKFTKDE